jgi:hypothetical protein
LQAKAVFNGDKYINPLCIAAASGRLELAELLLRAGAVDPCLENDKQEVACA